MSHEGYALWSIGFHLVRLLLLSLNKHQSVRPIPATLPFFPCSREERALRHVLEQVILLVKLSHPEMVWISRSFQKTQHRTTREASELVFEVLLVLGWMVKEKIIAFFYYNDSNS